MKALLPLVKNLPATVCFNKTGPRNGDAALVGNHSYNLDTKCTKTFVNWFESIKCIKNSIHLYDQNPDAIPLTGLHSDGLGQDCSISRVLALEMPQSCAKPSLSVSTLLRVCSLSACHVLLPDTRRSCRLNSVGVGAAPREASHNCVHCWGCNPGCREGVGELTAAKGPWSWGEGVGQGPRVPVAMETW